MDTCVICSSNVKRKNFVVFNCNHQMCKKCYKHAYIFEQHSKTKKCWSDTKKLAKQYFVFNKIEFGVNVLILSFLFSYTIFNWVEYHFLYNIKNQVLQCLLILFNICVFVKGHAKMHALYMFMVLLNHSLYMLILNMNINDKFAIYVFFCLYIAVYLGIISSVYLYRVVISFESHLKRLPI